MLVTSMIAAAVLAAGGAQVDRDVPELWLKLAPPALTDPLAAEATHARPSFPDGGELALDLFGSTIATGAGNAWYRETAIDKWADDLVPSPLKPGLSKQTRVRGFLWGLGLSAIAGTLGLTAASGRTTDTQRAASGPRGLGAAIGWRIPF